MPDWRALSTVKCAIVRDRPLYFTFTPHERNGIGSVRLAGARAALPLRLHQADVRESTTGFEARLTVDHGQAVRAHLRFRSEPDGSFVMTEKLVALTNITTAEIATGLIGILNNPHWIYEQARRRVLVDGQQVEVLSGCGQQWQWPDARRIAVDDVLFVQSQQPLRVSYVAADRAERGRVTDQLFLNHLPGNRPWAAGQTLSECQIFVRCPKPGQ